MRDYKRIQPLLTDIGNVWEQCFPDMRFMQVIVNFQSWLGSDGFYIEDDELIEKFCKFATEMIKNGKRLCILRSIPAADVRPVIMCRDCKFSEPWYDGELLCFNWNDNGVDVSGDGFCNYGKRK